MKISKVFGQILKEFRTERGFSQERLGFESGYHRTYISLLERGQKSPSLNTIFKLAESLNITPSEMILRVEEELGTSKNKRKRKESKK
ncbi:MAG TPA: helix-turn-helix transcriptional regulator [Syntrophomonadaceae bacterium]|nr:helix-turn-helix transcriptional regulator [Syntrophomonadaceae bacterium]